MNETIDANKIEIFKEEDIEPISEAHSVGSMTIKPDQADAYRNVTPRQQQPIASDSSPLNHEKRLQAAASSNSVQIVNNRSNLNQTNVSSFNLSNVNEMSGTYLNKLSNTRIFYFWLKIYKFKTFFVVVV